MVPEINLLAYSVGYTISGPGIVPTSNVDATNKLELYLSQILGVLSIVAVIFFTIQIILAGYGFMSSDGDEKKMETNRSKLTNSVMGLLIVVVAIGIGSLIAKLLGLNNPLDLNQIFTSMGL